MCHRCSLYWNAACIPADIGRMIYVCTCVWMAIWKMFSVLSLSCANNWCTIAQCLWLQHARYECFCILSKVWQQLCRLLNDIHVPICHQCFASVIAGREFACDPVICFWTWMPVDNCCQNTLCCIHCTFALKKIDSAWDNHTLQPTWRDISLVPLLHWHLLLLCTSSNCTISHFEMVSSSLQSTLTVKLSETTQPFLKI